MKPKLYLPWILLGLQIFLLFFGRNYFDKILNPILFFLVSLSLPVYLLSSSTTIQKTSNAKPWIFSFLSFIMVIISFEEVRKGFIHYPLPTPNSDVLLQLETMYDRMVHHQFPYSAIRNGNYSTYPVYMPMHFLPLALCKWLNMDIRWCGFWIYALASFLFGFQLGKTRLGHQIKICLSLLPALVLWAYLLFGEMDIFITLEVLIAAYYMILATGLLFRNKWILTLGIILCLLSRYTFIFWLPLLFLLLWKENKKHTFFMAIIIFCGLTFFYILPFFIKDPTILKKGITYHNHCAVDEWRFGFWSSEYRIHFAWIIHQLTGENMERGVKINRIVQAFALLVTLFLSILIYFRKKTKPDHYLYAFAFLNIFMLVFFSFCPLTYRYYLISLLELNALTICAFFIRKDSGALFLDEKKV